ncbi:uncharacterized protein LOC118512022 isoform X2 [Anopheles stephensi]|uniref:uncharacterized protein LOC118512022 isoform X2 n=1 Tax=Anopheles stephensi TaxID=30069 RepID=UPI0016588F40|nr:uncharacterized protein LOC118512022 isoform X2 [Anopheles stephensi]
MAGFTIYTLLVLGTSLVVLGSQHSPYSLQAAIDALHRREAQLALREEAAAEQLDDDGYWMEPTDEQQQQFRPNRQRLNRILANYLRRPDQEDPEDAYDPYDLDTRKRSVFRERDEQSSYPTVFRERELEKSYAHPDLSADFLKAVNREANAEREEEFQERLQQLWDKYQQEENEIEQRLFEEEPLQGPAGYEKRQGFPMSESEPSPAHYGPPMQERKRTLPILPWLPATRKKRFPVAKRSPKPEAPPSGTDEKVAKDLQALFGAPIEQKRKRSSEPAHAPVSSTASSGTSTTVASPTTERALEANKAKRESSDEHHEHSSEEGPDDDEHEHEHDHEESSEEFEGEDDDRKKKRSVRKRSNLEVVKEDQILPGDIGEFKSKKSIQWNKYFGMDRRKKDGRNGGPVPYPLSFYKTYDEDRKKKNINQDKLESMAQKLKGIEDLILDQMVKYTGDHEGSMTEPDELEKLKDKLVARLATAYSIEKMRHTLERLKDSVSDDQLKLNEVEPEQPREEKEKAKRVAVKKERAEYDHSQHSMEGNEKVAHEEVENNLDDAEGDKKKKKRTQKRYQEIFRAPEEPEMDDEFGRGLVVART